MKDRLVTKCNSTLQAQTKHWSSRPLFWFSLIGQMMYWTWPCEGSLLEKRRKACPYRVCTWPLGSRGCQIMSLQSPAVTLGDTGQASALSRAKPAVIWSKSPDIVLPTEKHRLYCCVLLLCSHFIIKMKCSVLGCLGNKPLLPEKWSRLLILSYMHFFFEFILTFISVQIVHSV